MDPLSPLAFALMFALPVHPHAGAIDYMDAGGTYPGRLALVRAPDGAEVLWVAHRPIDGLAHVVRLALAPQAVPETLATFPTPESELRPTGLAVDPAGAWIGTERGLYRLALPAKPGPDTPATLTRSGSEAPVRQLVTTPDGRVFAVAQSAAGGDSAAPVEAFATGAPLAGRATISSARAAVALGPSRIWVAGAGGIIEAAPRGAFRVDLAGTPLGALRGPEPLPIQDLAVSGTTIWIGVGPRGLFRADGERIRAVTPPMRISGLLADPAGGLFATTWSPAELVHLTGAPTPTSPAPAPRAPGTPAPTPAAPPPMRLWPLSGDEPSADLRVLAAGPEGLWLLEEPRQAPHRIVRLAPERLASAPSADADAFLTIWPLARPGRSYTSPGVIDALRDGHGGLFIATNDGVWHLR